MVQLSDELMAKIERTIATGHYARAEDVIEAGVDVVLKAKQLDAEFNGDAVPCDPDWKPSPEVERMIEESVGDQESLSLDEAEARFAAFRAKWLAARR